MKKNIFFALALLTCTPSLFAETPDLQDPFGPVYDPMDEEHATAHAFNQMRQNDDSQKLEQKAPEQTATRAPAPKKKAPEKPTEWLENQKKNARKKEIENELRILKHTQIAAKGSVFYTNQKRIIRESEKNQSSHGEWALGELVVAGVIAETVREKTVGKLFLIGTAVLGVWGIKDLYYWYTTPGEVKDAKCTCDSLEQQINDRATRITELEEELQVLNS